MTIRFGLTGLRHPHLEYLLTEISARDDVEIVALAEEDDAIRAQFAERLGVTAYADYREMYASETLDAIGTAAINNERPEMVVDALEAGMHVVSDKPLSTTLADLDRIEAAWRASGKHLSVLLDKRFYRPTLAVREMIAAGELGEIAMAWASAPHRLRRPTRPDWMFRHEQYGGILNDLCIHDIDLFLWFTGATSGQVQGFAGNKGNPADPEFQDYGAAWLRTDSGVLATFEVHWFSPEAAPYHGDYRIVLTGTEGTAELRFAHDELLVATNQRPPELREMPPLGSVAGDFFDAVLGGEPVVKTAEVLTATRVSLLAQEHANGGEWQSWEAVQG
jgi:predicted dehydrogenase